MKKLSDVYCTKTLRKFVEEEAMSEVKKCPKCEEVMIKGSEQILDDAFRCTRGGTEGLERLEKYSFRIQPYCCQNCGYIEFYKEGRDKP